MEVIPALIRDELTQLRNLPTPIAWWVVETGPDWTDDPAVWVWPVLEHEGVDFETRTLVRKKVRRLVRDVTRRETGTAWQPYVRFRSASEERAEAS